METRDVHTLLIDLRNCGGGYFLNGNRLLRYLKDERFFMHFFRPRGRVDRSRFLKSEFWVTMTRFSFELMPDLQKNGQRDYKLHYKPIRRHHFDGKIVVLIDGGSFSMSANVAAMLALEPKTTLIGEESGGAAEGANAILWRKLVLPHTGVSVSIPECHLSNQYPNGPFGRGLIPDRELKPSPEDVLSGRDPVLEQVCGE